MLEEGGTCSHVDGARCAGRECLWALAGATPSTFRRDRFSAACATAARSRSVATSLRLLPFLVERLPAAAVECHSMPLLRDVLDLFLGFGYERVEVTRGGDHVGPPTVLATPAGWQP
jgi:hypothetical protein